jgi:methylmalonyl-CoA mutase cobalamin-binding subunit
MKTIVLAALGECVHVAGIVRFLRLAESVGWRTVFLGPAVPIEQVLEAARREKADLVGISYRLTPESGERLLAEFAEEADDLRSAGVQFVFGGTPPLADRARKLGFFEYVFEGGELTEDVLAYLKGQSKQILTEKNYPQSTIERIAWKAPYPIIRHHFGLPTLVDTTAGIKHIADARVLDVISLGIDQDAQANFFHPERQNPRRKGAGGVPVRTPDDYRVLFNASKRGNYPLMRSYSGTDDFIRLAEMYIDTINIAWAAVPLFWFNQMDGRGPWNLEDSIREHQNLMAWYGLRNIPVELNEPHHWGMRDASDVIFAVTAYLSAYNARAAGVHDYIAQLMFNSPPGLSDAMDLAKMLAVLKLIEPLAGPDFHIWRQTRTGLLSYPLDIDAARAHLSVSIYLQMAIKPHIVHVVGHTEADHAATSSDVIEACKLSHRAIENAIQGQPDMTHDPFILQRKEEILQESQITLNAIRSLADPGVDDPFTDTATLSQAITAGILDAPHLRNNPFARGQTNTRIDNRGASISINPSDGQRITERDRIAALYLTKEGVN